MTRVFVRYILRTDLRTALEIDRLSFPEPLTKDDMLTFLRRPSCLGYVAERGERVLGFLLYERHRDRLHIAEFAVHPDHRRQGIGRQLTTKLQGVLASHGRTRITLTVRETNLRAQLFWRAMGFRATTILRNHLGTGDAYAMKYVLDESVSEARPVHTAREC